MGYTCTVTFHQSLSRLEKLRFVTRNTLRLWNKSYCKNTVKNKEYSSNVTTNRTIPMLTDQMGIKNFVEMQLDCCASRRPLPSPTNIPTPPPTFLSKDSYARINSIELWEKLDKEKMEVHLTYYVGRIWQWL